jgi:D-xylose transport system ATP-binding protein
MTPAPVLEARRITKRFGGVQALNDVSFSVLPCEVHALCGENGAGKSTLMKVLTGLHPAGSFDGEVAIDGRRAEFRDVRDSERAGIGIVHQELSLVDSLTAAENILLGKYPGPGWRVDWPATFATAGEILKRFSVPIDPEMLVAELGVGQQQLVEIARALSKEPRILLLDEPTAALSSGETESLLGQVRQLCAAGVACVYISHKLDEVMQIADRVTILRDGATVATFDARETDVPTIIRHMVGREIQDVYPQRAPSEPGNVALEVVRLSARGEIDHHVALHEVSFDLRAGEVLGIGGLMGAGRSELLMHLYGLWGKPIAGEVRVGGRLYSQRSPRKSIERGIMMVTESRKRFGIVPNQSTHHNLSLSSLPAISRCGRLQPVAEYRRNKAMLRKMQFRALQSDGRVDQLSGGNQQKVVIGRGLLTEPAVVLLDEPTRGVDVGAKREIYQEINRLAGEGKAVAMVSSELPELMGMCDRIVMMQRGRMTGAFKRGEFDATRLMAAAINAE